MPRNNKKTRIKGLPPRLQLQHKDAITGSYPAHVRVASDNRSGDYGIQWNDNNTIVFDNIGDIRDNIINYYRFNSGSLAGEVIPNPSTPSTSSWLVRPTFSNTGSKKVTDDSVSLTFQVNNGATVGGISTDVPFAGPGGDPNPTSFSFYPSDYSFATGTLDVFNPGVSTAISGAPEKPFSVGMWVQRTGTATPGTLLSVGKNHASWSAGIISSASLIVETTLAGYLTALLLDSNGNSIGASVTNVLTLYTWTHLVLTYDGSKQLSGINVYINGNHATAGNVFQGTLGAYEGMQTSYGNDLVSIGILGKSSDTIFNGKIDEVVFVDKALTLSEARALYQSTAGIHKPNKYNKFPNGVYLGAGLSTNSSYWHNAIVDDLVTDFSTSLYQPGPIKKGIGDNLAHFTPGQDFTPFRDFDNPAVDGKSTNDPFYATGSNPLIFGTALQQPLWSKSKIEIDIGCRTSSTQQLYIGQTTGSLEYSSVNNVGPPDSDLGWSYPISYYNFVYKRWEGIGPGYIFPGSINHTGSYLVVGRNDSPLVNDYVFWGFTPSILMYSPTGESTSATGGLNPVADLRISGQFDFMTSAGQPCTNFGFPYHPKFHATSSQLFDVSTVIKEPFLIEKIVVEMSAAFQVFPDVYNTASVIFGGGAPFLNSLISGTLPAAINNLFILNQRTIGGLTHDEFVTNLDALGPGNPIIHTRWPMSAALASSPTGPKIETVTTFRDLISWGGVSSFAKNMPDQTIKGSDRGLGGFIFSPDLSQFSFNPKTLMTREVTFESDVEMTNDLTPMSWTGSFKMELTAKHAVRFTRPDPKANPVFNFMMETFIQSQNDATEDFSMGVQYQGGSRNGVGISLLSGRDRRSAIASLNSQDILTNANIGTVATPISFVSTKNMSIENPYLLLPGDQLIIGWHQPIPRVMEPQPSNNNTRNMEPRGVFSEITFPEGPAKIIIYGSPLREDHEEHSTLNQLLTSNTVHEVIE